VVEYDPFSADAMADPYPLYRVLRDQHPVYPLPQYDAWALARFADVWEVIGDAQRFSILDGPSFAREALGRPADLTRERADPRLSFAMWDPPQHTRIRHVMSPAFRPGAVGRLEEGLRRAARERLAPRLGLGRLEVVRDYAGPISAAVMCEVLGFPAGDAEALREHVNAFARRDPGRPGATPASLQAMGALHAYGARQARARRAQGAGGAAVTDALIRADLDGWKLSDEQVGVQLVSLLVGGVETLPKLLAGGLLQLEDQPEVRAGLARDTELCSGAFEEIIRHQGVLQHVGRTLLCDAQIGGQPMRRGQRLFLLLQSANRDAREFPDPDRFDVGRRPARHLGLGHGPHHCIGAHIARLEGRILLEELLRAIPQYRVDPASLERPPSEFQLGYTALALEFEPRPSAGD
jgi:cytochrome P450